MYLNVIRQPVVDNPVSQLEKYRERMYKPTSRSDLQYMLNDKVKIINYDELMKYTTFKDLMDPYQSVIILYPNADDPEVGHWCCIFIIPGTNRCEYFDPYGAYIDNPVEEYNEEMESLHQRRRIEPKLLELLIDSPYGDNCWWNETPFQSIDIASQVCGLWCAYRLKNNHLTEKDFKRLYFDTPTSQGIVPDMLIAALTCDQYPDLC
jgi:hypothetical protein